jgi:hypothetical protein
VEVVLKSSDPTALAAARDFVERSL